MPFVYAQLNNKNICIGISRLSGEISADDLVRIDNSNEDLLWRKYNRDKDEWSDEKYEPEQLPELTDELTQLRLAMAEMAEAHEREKTELQLAIAELAEMITGGVG